MAKEGLGLMYMLLAIFWLEAVMTLVQGVWALINPSSWVSTVLDLDTPLDTHIASIARPAIAHLVSLLVELIRWFGVVCIVLALALLQSVSTNIHSSTLQEREHLTKLLVPLTLGDILQTLGCFNLYHVAGGLGRTNLATIIITVVLFASRVAWFAHLVAQEKAAPTPATLQLKAGTRSGSVKQS